MIKKTMIFASAIVASLVLCSCGSAGVSNNPTTSQQPSTSQADSKVDSIDLTLKGGNLRFIRAEKANDQLTEEENAYVFVYDFTNETDDPVPYYTTFDIEYYQHGVELNNGGHTYSSTGGEQYELVSSGLNSVMKGVTTTFGEIVQVKDDSPVTVLVRGIATTANERQMMEVTISNL